jgi:hypothetical protein
MVLLFRVFPSPAIFVVSLFFVVFFFFLSKTDAANGGEEGR